MSRLAAFAASVFLLCSCAGGDKRPPLVLDPLNLAVQNGDPAAIRAALDAGGDPCAKQADGNDALDRLLYHPENAEPVVAAAAERGCPGALARAAHYGLPRQVKALLAHGAAPGGVPGISPPLILASSGMRNATDSETDGQVEAARLLLDAGADPNARGQNGYPPLFYAITNKHPRAAKLLIERGADPNGRGYQDAPLLVEAVSHGETGVARLLVEKGADPEAAISVFEQRAMHWQNRMAAPYAGAYEQNQLQAARNSVGLVQRLAAERRAPAAAGATKEELASLVQAAVEKAAAKAAPAPKAAPSSDVDRPSYRRPERAADLAVVVGVTKYSDLVEAAHGERDAEAVKDHLIAQGFPSRNVVLLSGEKASRSALEKFVETWLPRNARPESRVVFYFSGHGAPDPASGKAYLVPWDGDPGFLENTAYPVARLYEKLGALKARSVLVALDACFSGSGGRSVLAKGARPLVARADAGAVPASLTVLAAAAGEEIASTDEAQGHGLFTYHLLKGLSAAERGADGAISAKALHAYLTPKVQDAARRLNRAQTPTLSGDASIEVAR